MRGSIDSFLRRPSWLGVLLCGLQAFGPAGAATPAASAAPATPAALSLELRPASSLQPLGLTGGAPLQPPVAFSGSTTLHGILVAQWLRAEGDTGAPAAVFQLLPVPQSAALMPHFQGAPLKFITLVNGRELLARATSEQIAREFDSRQRGVIHVEGLFTLRGLSLGQPCLRAARAEITEVDPIRVRFPARPEAITCPP
jgi:hypothetical protein